MRIHPALWPLLMLTCAGFADPATPVAEPLDATAGRWWVAPAPEVVLDPLRHELRPSRPDQPAAVTWRFQPTGPTPHLSLSYAVRLRAGGDRLQWLVSTNGQDYTVATEQTYRGGEHQLDADPYLDASRSLYLRLVLETTTDPLGVALTKLTWTTAQLARVRPAQPWLPPSCWLESVWAALSTWRVAPKMPAGEATQRGLGRLVRPVLAAWSPTADGLAEAEVWDAGPRRAGHVRLLTVPTGANGGEVKLGDQTVAQHSVSGLPLQVALTPEVAPAGPLPRLTVDAKVTDQLSVADLGPLELRWLRASTTLDETRGTVHLAAVVVNHTERTISGNLRAILRNPSGASVVETSSGFRFAPGAWVAPLTLELRQAAAWRPGGGTVYTLEAAVDDGLRISDGTTRSVGFRTATMDGTTIHCGEFDLAPTRAGGDLSALKLIEALQGRTNGYAVLTTPVAPEALDLADRLAVPVVIVCPAGDELLEMTQSLLFGDRPAVLKVTTEPSVGP